MKPLKSIMFVGTGSDVGKSIINTAFCRIFLQDGYRPAPFKAQNMSLNSYATKSHLEIGRAQAVQAEACGIDCTTDMNPVLLKPTNYITSQVVLNGKPIGNESASEFFIKRDRDHLFTEVAAAYHRLQAKYNPIVLEGAGSISEINLWSKDIVNMRMALHANAATYLVADIDKGGVFASVYGSIKLLPEEERKAIKGIIINKFRGDINLFTQGRKILEELTGVPVVGVIPYFQDLFIEQEDAITQSGKKTDENDVKIAVVLLRHISNFTDFNMLERTEGVRLYYTRNPDEIVDADIVILPGSKNTLSDLNWLRTSGLSKSILKHYKAGKPLYGICGGFQMMGKTVEDPLGIEGEIASMPGLGIFPVSTTLAKGKQTRQCHFTFIHSDAHGKGYEIHAGETPTAQPLTRLNNGEEEGYYLNNRCWGSYLHGIFDNPSVIESILQEINISAKAATDYQAIKEHNYNLLADLVRQNINLDYIYKTLQND